jgi:hypothetical protein
MTGPGLTNEPPAGPLGPKFEIAWRVPDETPTGATVRQDLYPQAAGGPVTYTESGQPVFGNRTAGGWYRGPATFTRVLQQLGLPTAAAGYSAPAPSIAAAPATSATHATSWLPMAGAVLAAVFVAGLLVAVLLVRRRRTSRMAATVASSS